MTHTTHIGRTARRFAILPFPLLVVATGTATAHGGGANVGGDMMGGVWGLFGGTMGPLWMALLLAVPLLLAYALFSRGTDGNGRDDRPLSLLRERYARGELSDDEFERQRATLERGG